MGKHLMILTLFLLNFGWTALPVFAGTTIVNGAPTVSLEAMGTARSVTISAPPGDAITYFPSLNLSVGNKMWIIFANATFVSGTTYNLCIGMSTIGTATPGAVSVFNFNLNQAVFVPAKVHLTDEPSCLATGQGVSLRLNSTSSVTSATIRFRTVTAGGIEIDATPPVTLATIGAEYSASVNASSHIIDVVNAFGEQFTGPIASGTGVGATGADAAPRVLADSARGNGGSSPSIRLAIAPKTLEDDFFGLTAAAIIRVTDSNNFQGVSQVFIADSGTICNSTASIDTASKRAEGILSGNTATINVPASKFSAATAPGNVDLTFCALVDGVSLQQPRTFSARVEFHVTGPPGCCNVPAATSVAPVQTWNINGAEIYVTGVWANATDGKETVISINNLGTSDGSIRRLEVYRLDATTTGIGPDCLVTPVTTKTIFAKSGNTLKGTEINVLCATQATFLSQEAYGVRLLLDIAPGNVRANSVRIFPDGRLVSLPVLKGSAGGAAFTTE